MTTRSPWMPAALIALAATAQAAGGPTVNVTYPASLAAGPLDGRLLLLLSTDAERGAAPPDQRHRLEHAAGLRHRRRRLEARAGRDVRRRRASAIPLERLAATCPPGTYTRAGAAPPLRDVPPRGRPRGQAADGPRRGPAVEPRARATSTARRARSRSIRPRRGDHDRARQGDPADPRPAGHEVRQARAHPERAAHRVLGPPHVPGRARAPARGLRRAPGRALSAGHQPRPLPRRLRRLPRGAARPGPQARATASASSSTATTAPSRSTPTSSTRTGRARASRAC